MWLERLIIGLLFLTLAFALLLTVFVVLPSPSLVTVMNLASFLSQAIICVLLWRTAVNLRRRGL